MIHLRKKHTKRLWVPPTMKALKASLKASEKEAMGQFKRDNLNPDLMYCFQEHKHIKIGQCPDKNCTDVRCLMVRK